MAQVGSSRTLRADGDGSPEGVVPANPGALYTDDAAGDLWIKQTGTGVTGWVKIGAAGSVIPAGGDTGQALTKVSGTDFDMDWAFTSGLQCTSSVTGPTPLATALLTATTPLGLFPDAAPDLLTAAQLTLPISLLGAGGALFADPVIAVPAFLASGDVDVQAALWVANNAGTVHALLATTTYDTIPAGPFGGGTFPLDLTANPPVIVGADLTVVGDTSIESTAGGLYSGTIVLSLVYD